jgi:hypothetical protein
MREKSSEEEPDSAEEGESHSDNQEPEYSFAGFNVEFSEKIVLTPLAADASAQEKGRVGP